MGAEPDGEAYEEHVGDGKGNTYSIVWRWDMNGFSFFLSFLVLVSVERDASMHILLIIVVVVIFILRCTSLSSLLLIFSTVLRFSLYSVVHQLQVLFSCHLFAVGGKGLSVDDEKTRVILSL